LEDGGKRHAAVAAAGRQEGLIVGAALSLRARFDRWLHGAPDDSVLRWLFRAMLAITVTVLAVDFWQLNEREMQPNVSLPQLQRTADPATPLRPRGDRGAPKHQSDAALHAPMWFELLADGRLNAVGTISPGTAKTFAEEIAKRGSYVKTVVLHSPGGSVADALEMGRLIRQKGFNTAVETGRYCASSCPLMFAGGVERYAGDKAVVGVHQVFSISQVGAPVADTSEAVQRVAAECQRYLREMGVDLEVWMRAMETPRDALYYFKQDELLSLKLATQRGDARTPFPASSAKS
jgi:hypothetical protein